MLKIGHRGAMGYAPENTLASFEKAVSMSDMIELDVYALPSGQVLVFHDHRLERCTNGKGTLLTQSFESLRQLDAGNGQQIPTLQEVLHLIDNRVAVNIELKGPHTALPVSILLQHYIHLGKYTADRFLVSSFNHPELMIFKKSSPNIAIGCLISCVPLYLAEIAEEMGAEYLNVSGEFITQKLVDDAHERGIKVLVYTVNFPDDIAYIKSLGVDGIFSNYPDRL